MIVKTRDFEGPLDLLLHLIRSHELEIETLDVLAIAEHYIEIVLNSSLEESTDFVLMASHLIAIKARYLNKGEEPSLVVEDDPLEDLVEKLRVYRRVKEIGEYLKERENTDYHFFKEGSIDQEDDKFTLHVTLLSQALQRVLEKTALIDENRKGFFQFKRRTFPSVKEKSRKILAILEASESIAFSDLFDTKEDVIAGFLALLELLKAGAIRVAQSTVFGEIYIKKQKNKKHNEDTWNN